MAPVADIVEEVVTDSEAETVRMCEVQPIIALSLITLCPNKADWIVSGTCDTCHKTRTRLACDTCKRNMTGVGPTGCIPCFLRSGKRHAGIITITRVEAL